MPGPRRIQDVWQPSAIPFIAQKLIYRVKPHPQLGYILYSFRTRLFLSSLLRHKSIPAKTVVATACHRGTVYATLLLVNEHPSLVVEHLLKIFAVSPDNEEFLISVKGLDCQGHIAMIRVFLVITGWRQILTLARAH